MKKMPIGGPCSSSYHPTVLPARPFKKCSCDRRWRRHHPCNQGWLPQLPADLHRLRRAGGGRAPDGQHAGVELEDNQGIIGAADLRSRTGISTDPRLMCCDIRKFRHFCNRSATAALGSTGGWSLARVTPFADRTHIRHHRNDVPQRRDVVLHNR